MQILVQNSSLIGLGLRPPALSVGTICSDHGEQAGVVAVELARTCMAELPARLSEWRVKSVTHTEETSLAPILSPRGCGPLGNISCGSVDSGQVFYLGCRLHHTVWCAKDF